MSVTFCLGNVSVKRRAFNRREAGVVTVDNDDLLLHFRLGGKLYCALGKLPFSDFTVRDFVAYNRALRVGKPLNDSEIRFILRSVGFTRALYARVGSLSRVQYRHLCLAAKLEIDTKVIRLNFDGLQYTARHRRQLLHLLKTLDGRFDTYVAVTDTRFVPPFAATAYYADGGITHARRGKQLSRPACKAKLLRRFRGRDIPLCGAQVRKILVVTGD